MTLLYYTTIEGSVKIVQVLDRVGRGASNVKREASQLQLVLVAPAPYSYHSQFYKEQKP